MRYKLWTMLYAAAVACVVLCVVLVYQITVSGDVSNEFFIYILVILGFALFSGGYLIEARYKKQHPEEYSFEMPESSP